MTKPVSEPTPALEASNYGYRIRQLERRPGPRATELPYADMYWYFPGGVTIPDSTSTAIGDLGAGTAAFTTDTTVFSVDLGNSIISWDDTTQHGAPALAKGLIVWASGDADGSRNLQINGNGAYSLAFEIYNTSYLQLNTADDPGRYQEVDMKFFLGHASEETTGSITLGIYHEMGADRDIVWAEMSIIRLSPTQAFDDVDPGGTYFP